ncbi:MAG: hypothetical protein LBL59_04525 [Xanthomonadaceae bacterium]|nr:hypothetical protein [Xanthomonadaceae bacterium]
MAAINAAPRVVHHFSGALIRDRSDALALRTETALADKSRGFWTLEPENERRFIGFIGIENDNATLPISPREETGGQPSTGIAAMPPRPPGRRSGSVPSHATD